MKQPISHPPSTVLIVGASGGIGRALVNAYLQSGWQVLAVSRMPNQPTTKQQPGQPLEKFLEHSLEQSPEKPQDQPQEQPNARLIHLIGGHHETSIEQLINNSIADYAGLITRVIITTGMLHDQTLKARLPEKKLADFSSEGFMKTIEVNTLLPALWVARLEPILRKSNHTVMAVLSARVGSISDNQLGGWYSYRSSKAALNMLLKSAAIEYARRAPHVKMLAFHPGTTDTALSRPFQANVPADKLFSPDFVAAQLIEIMNSLKPDGQLSYLDWQGKSIEW